MDRKVVIMDHPLIQHKLSILRDVDTSTMEFRELVNEIAMLMMYDATRDLPLEMRAVTTPLRRGRTGSGAAGPRWRLCPFSVPVWVW